MGHVFAHLIGYGVQLLPYWPYRFVRPVEDDPTTVCVVRLTPDGERSAQINVQDPSSVEGIVDVTVEPSPDGWRVETTLFSIPWPEGFDVDSPTAEGDRKPFYLLRDDGAAIFPQGPELNERIPPPGGWAAAGQTIVSRGTSDDIEIIELAYELDGESWWQCHWVIPWSTSRMLVFSAQAPDHAVERTRHAAREVVWGVLPTVRRA